MVLAALFLSLETKMTGQVGKIIYDFVLMAKSRSVNNL